MNFSYIRNIANTKQHYYGWGHIIKQFINSTKLLNDGVVLDTWVDQKNDKQQLDLISNNLWIGILHATPSNINNYSLRNFINSDNFKLSKKNCQCLITTSEHSKKHLKSLTDLPVKVLLHPKPNTGHCFDLDYYLANPSIRHSGFYARNIINFIKFDTNIRKVIYSDRENRNNVYNKTLNSNSHSIIYKSQYLENSDYIHLLTTSIGFSFFDDCSASNSILEHIMTHTPLIINRIPPIEEYLGRDYPLFIDCLDGKNDKLLLDINFIKDVSQYLEQVSKREEFSIDYFNNYLHTLSL